MIKAKLYIYPPHGYLIATTVENKMIHLDIQNARLLRDELDREIKRFENTVDEIPLDIKDDKS